MEKKERIKQRSGGFETEQTRYKGGSTVIRLRSISRNSTESDKGLKGVKILKKNHGEPKEIFAKSDTVTSSNPISSSSGKEGLKFLTSSGTKDKHKLSLEKRSGRDEATSTGHKPQHQQIYVTSTAKIKTKTPHGQVTKQKGDGGKIRDRISVHSAGHNQQERRINERSAASKLEGRSNRLSTTGQQSSNTSEKDSTKQKKSGVNSKKQCESSRRRPSKPPQYPSEEDVNSTAKLLKSRGYLMEGKLGEGTYAKVRRAYSYHHNCRVAIKIVSRNRLNARFQNKFLPRELEIVRNNRHPHIIELLEMFESNGVIFMIMELARHGDLLEYVQKKNALRDSEARTVFTQILSAVEYLHNKGIFHRDLKCENVLLDWGPTGITAKITDFGFARPWYEANRPCATFCGSAAYASPEILQAIPYDPHWADIWSMGVVLYIMITGRMPFDDSNIKEALEDMHNNRLNFSRRRLICIEVQRLLRAMLTYEPRDRPTTQEIKMSPWMRGRCTMPKPSARISASVGGV